MREFLKGDGFEFIYQRLIGPSTGTVYFASALNRTVIGSMNELVKEAIFRLEREEISPHDLGFRLNETLLSAVPSNESKAYGNPRDAFKQLGVQ